MKYKYKICGAVYLYEMDRNASVEYTLLCTKQAEYPTTTVRGGTEFRSQIFLGASVHGQIFIAYTQEE